MLALPVRVLLVALADDADALQTAIQDAGVEAEVTSVEAIETAVEAIRRGAVDVCFASSTSGPDPSASLTLALARMGAYVPVVAVVDVLSAGFEAIADEGAADFVWRGDLSPESVGRALLVAHARAEAVARFQAVQADRDAVLAATGAVVMTLDDQGRLLDLRAASGLESDFGEAAPGARFASVFAADARAGAVHALRQASQGATGRFVQTRARAGRPLFLRWVVAQDAEGYRAVGVDGSEANREAYRADLHRMVLDAILTQMPVTVFVVDAEGKFLLVLGEEYGMAGLQGSSIFETYRDEPRVVANVQRALAGDTFDDRFVIRDGRSYLVHYAPFPLGDNEPPGALGVATNVTDTRLTTTESTRLDALLDLTGSATLIADAVGEPLYLSPPLQQIVGWDAQSLRAAGGVSLLFANPPMRTEIARCVRGGDVWTGETTLQSASGAESEVHIEARPLLDAEGTRIGSIAHFLLV